jgi:asparagine synthase (glutamine-hydrolysing)
LAAPPGRLGPGAFADPSHRRSAGPTNRGPGAAATGKEGHGIPMCGIVGYLNLDRGQAAEADLIKAMCDTIVHRGPNDMGLHVDGEAGIGMRRLSIIDVSTGHQPIANEDGTVWIVFNGEIYNHRELRERLEGCGHRFRTSSDTEAILHLYEEDGCDCVQSLRGMFAFAIWDSRDRSLLVARDRLGIKPLFYAQTGARFAFASEIKALLALPGLDRTLDWNGFDAFFAYTYIPAPLTIYRSIRQLEAGHYLQVADGKTTVTKYWDLDFADKLRGSEQSIADGFLEVMEQATTMRLMSEVPLGSFLSGGVDSGLVVSLMSAPDRDAVKTFTIGFGGNTGSFLDERPFARQIAERYDCDHREIEVIPRIEEAMDAAVAAFDEPFADDSIIPTFHICEEAKRHVTVVLTGLGGDENFAGYERYLGLHLSQVYSRLPGPVRRGLIGPLARALPESAGGGNRVDHLKRFVAGDALPAARRYQSYLRVLDPGQRRRLYSPEVAGQVDFEYVESLGWRYFEQLPEGDIIDRALYQDLKMYLPDDILALSDRVGMHHSLELRVPFIDHKVVEYCARIPSSLKIRSGDKKYLLKGAARRYLPDAVIDHRKQGFSSPMAIWLRSDLRASVERLLGAAELERRGFFSPAEVGGLVAAHDARRRLNHKTIFSLMMFNKWVEAAGQG